MLEAQVIYTRMLKLGSQEMICKVMEDRSYNIINHICLNTLNFLRNNNVHPLSLRHQAMNKFRICITISSISSVSEPASSPITPNSKIGLIFCRYINKEIIIIEFYI